MDLENTPPDCDLPRPSFNKKWFWATAFLSVFVLQAPYASGPLYSEDDSFWQQVIIDIVSFYGSISFAISFGFRIGFKPVVVAGFFTLAFWSVIFKLSILSESDSLRNLAIVLKSMWVCFPNGICYIVIFHFKQYGKMRLIGAAVSLLVFATITNLAVPYILTPPWTRAVYGFYCFAMGIALYLNIPNTAHTLENENLLELSPYLIGCAGYLFSVFTWLQLKTAFQSWVAYVLFLAVCVSAGLLTVGMMMLGWPSQWKQAHAELKLIQKLIKEWYTFN